MPKISAQTECFATCFIYLSQGEKKKKTAFLVQNKGFCILSAFGKLLEAIILQVSNLHFSELNALK